MAGKICLFPIMEIEEMIKDEIRERYPKASESDVNELYRRQIMLGSEKKASQSKEQQYRDDYMAHMKDALINFTKSESFKSRDTTYRNKIINLAKATWVDVVGNIHDGISSIGKNIKDAVASLEVSDLKKTIDQVKENLKEVSTPENIADSEHEYNEYSELKDKLSKLEYELGKAELKAANPYEEYVDAMTWMEKNDKIIELSKELGLRIPDSKFALLDINEVYQKDPMTQEEMEQREASRKKYEQSIIDEQQRLAQIEAEKEFDVLDRFGGKDNFKESLKLTGVKTNAVNKVKWALMRSTEHATRTLKTQAEKIEELSVDKEESLRKITKKQKKLNELKKEYLKTLEHASKLPNNVEEIGGYVKGVIETAISDILNEFNHYYSETTKELIRKNVLPKIINEDGSINQKELSNFLEDSKIVAEAQIPKWNEQIKKIEDENKKEVDSIFNSSIEPYQYQTKDQEIKIGDTIKVSSDRNLDLNDRKVLEKIASQHGIDIKDTDTIVVSLTDEVKADASRKIEISVFRKTGKKEIDYKIKPKEVDLKEKELNKLTKQMDDKINEINIKFSDMYLKLKEELLNKYKNEDRGFSDNEDTITGKDSISKEWFDEISSKFRKNKKLSEREITLKTLSEMETWSIDDSDKLRKIKIAKSRLKKLDKFREELSEKQSLIEEQKNKELKNVKEKIKPKIDSIKEEIKEKTSEYRKENKNLIIKELKQFVDMKKYSETKDLLSSINVSYKSIKYMIENDLITPKSNELLKRMLADEATMKKEFSGKGLERNFDINSSLLKDPDIASIKNEIETADKMLNLNDEDFSRYLSTKIVDKIKRDEQIPIKYINEDHTINRKNINDDFEQMKQTYKNILNNERSEISKNDYDLRKEKDENLSIVNELRDINISYSKADKNITIKNFTQEDLDSMPHGFKDGIIFIDKNIVPEKLGKLDILKDIKWNYTNLKQALELGIVSEKGERQFMFDGSKKDKELFNSTFRQQDAKNLFQVNGEYKNLSASDYFGSHVDFKDSTQNAIRSIVGTSKHIKNTETLIAALEKVTAKEIIDKLKKWSPNNKEFSVMSKLQQRYVLQTSPGIDPFYIDTLTNTIPEKSDIISAIEDAIYDDEGIFNKVSYETVKQNMSQKEMDKFISKNGIDAFNNLIKTRTKVAQAELAISQNEEILKKSGWKLDYINSSKTQKINSAEIDNLYREHLQEKQVQVGNHLSIVSEYISKVVNGLQKDSPESFDRAMRTISSLFNSQNSLTKIGYLETTVVSKLGQEVAVHNLSKSSNLYLQADPLNGRVDLMWVSHSEQLKNKQGEKIQSFDQRKHNLISFFSDGREMSRHDSLIDLFVEKSLEKEKLNESDLKALNNNQKIKRIGEKIISDNKKLEQNFEIYKQIIDEIKPSIQELKNIDPSLVESKHYWTPKTTYTEMNKYNALERIRSVTSQLKLNRNGELSQQAMVKSAYENGSYKNIQILDTQAGRTLIFTNDNVVETKIKNDGTLEDNKTGKSNRLKIAFEERDGSIIAKISIDDSGYTMKTFDKDHPSYDYAKTLFDASYEKRENLTSTTQNIEKTRAFEALNKMQAKSNIDKLEKMNYNKSFKNKMKRSFRMMDAEKGSEEYNFISKEIAANTIKQSMSEAYSLGEKNVAYERAINKFINWVKGNERIKDGQQMIDILQNVSRMLAGRENALHDMNYTVEKSEDGKSSFKIPQNEKFEMAKKLVDALVPIYGNKEGLPENKEDAIAAIIKSVAEGGSLLKTNEQEEKIFKLRSEQKDIEKKDSVLLGKIETIKTAIFKLNKDITNNNLSKYIEKTKEKTKKTKWSKITPEEAAKIKDGIRLQIKDLEKERALINEQRSELADRYDKIENHIEWIDTKEVIKVTPEEEVMLNEINSGEQSFDRKDSIVDFDRPWVENKIKPSVEAIEEINKQQDPIKEELSKTIEERNELNKQIKDEKIFFAYDVKERNLKVKNVQFLEEKISSLKADIYALELSKKWHEAHINRVFSTGNAYRESWLISMFKDNLKNRPNWWVDSKISFKPGEESFKNIYSNYLEHVNRERKLERTAKIPESLEDLNMNDEYSFGQLVKLLDSLTHRVVESGIAAEGNVNNLELEPDLEMQEGELAKNKRKIGGKLNISVNEEIGMNISKAMNAFGTEIINMIEGQNINLEDKILDNMTSTVPMIDPNGDAYENNGEYQCQA